ncbi:MetQ/NlpA family ABC transporter substrate-binding protein [Cereibacter azotoformans]|uniref:D-methionine transport system substrate-binding protein n=1 Tax=Cereibacter azotoformans TaxID=43057 RepID=A0A2T5JT32_9RHOB|nr:MetQ/NlpA family ABC transporter substrate-binding protein [Cereibacter azotoformans]PTR12962.1 D-methionine transport system substrate-binding protein [Cereibacter azotoformans]
MSRTLLSRDLLLGATGAALLALPALAETLRIGVTPGPHAQILEAVRPIAAQKGHQIEIIEFSDYVVPNEALNAGEIEANSFQNQPYLDNQIRDRGYDIVPVAQTVNFPLGIYSTKHDNWASLPEGATVAIQNDPTNGGRSLLLLRDHGAITLREGVGFTPTVADIVENPKKLKILEIDAAQTARSLPDVDAAAVNTNYATEAGLKPSDAILREDPKGPYVNLIAVRKADADAAWVKDLVGAYHSPEVRAFIDAKFEGSVLPAW